MFGFGRKKSVQEDERPVISALFSDQGERDNNEDYTGMYERNGEYCFAVADGLGGHSKGELASRLAVEAAVREFAVSGSGRDILEQSFEAAQRDILSAQKRDRAAFDMKTTLVVLHISDKYAEWGHIGDSRLYYFEDRKLKSRTLDHSVPQMLVSAGRIKESRIRHHPDRNRLLRVLGVEWDSPRYQLSEPIKRSGSQQFLMATDGFWELIDEKHMQQTLKKAASPEEWLDAMKAMIISNGRGSNMDNFSAAAVWIRS